MADSYTVFWTNDYCAWLERHGAAGRPLGVLFGGPHQSAPRFTRFGVRPGDRLYPVRVLGGTLYVIARMTVARIISVEDYIDQFLGAIGTDPAVPLYRVKQSLLEEHPELEHRIPQGCVDEAALAEEGTPIRFDVAFPSSRLDGLRFRSRRGERGLKHVEDGKLKHSISLQGGVYRLSPDSAVEFERLTPDDRDAGRAG